MSFAYKDDAERILLSAPADREVTIPLQVWDIYGETSSYNAFAKARSVLINVIFPIGCSVKKISNCAFYGCNKLSKIDLSECKHLEEISDEAFYCCSAANAIILPNSTLTTLGYACFYGIKKVDSVYIPKTVKTFGRSVFWGCNMSTFTFDPDIVLTTLPMWAFYDCPNLKELTIPRRLISFGNVFNTKCTSLVNLYVAEGNTISHSIDGVIYSNDNKTLLDFPRGRTGNYTIIEGTEKVDFCSFLGSHISYVNFPQSLLTIGVSAFSDATLKEFIFPPKLENILDYGLSGTLIEDIVFPSKFKKIGSKCFSKCLSLKRVVMPDEYTEIGGGLFTDCSKDINVVFGNNSDLKVGDQDIVYNTEKTSIHIYFGEHKNITIIKSVVTIYHSVFSGKKELQIITFESGSALETIWDEAFCETGIIKLVLPDKLSYIGRRAFRSCISLVSVEFGSSLKTLQPFAFDLDSQLVTVIFKDSEYTIGNNAFSGCTAIEQIDFGQGVTEIQSNAFAYCTVLQSIKFPKTLVKMDMRAFGVCVMLKNVEFEKGCPLVNISSYLFEKCPLETIKFSESIKYFGGYSFTETNIKVFEIPTSLETIDPYTFYNCKSLVTLVIPANAKLDYIGYAAFYGCFAFENITLENNESFTLINGALYNKLATKLIVVPPNIQTKFFHFPETLRVIGQSALLHCINIEQMFIPSNSVVEIQNNAFEDCLNLLNINIPECVTKIGREAFKNCKELQCGLLIENRTTEFIENLVGKALMKSICLNTCERICSIERVTNKRPFGSLLLLFSILN